MTKLNQTKFHKVLLAEMRRDVLVVTPQGDAIGFRASDIQKELKTLDAIVDTPEVVHLVVDLGRGVYFGSVILGALNSLALKVRNAGGRIAICNASEDMRGMLKALKLDNFWVLFDSVKSALKAFEG